MDSTVAHGILFEYVTFDEGYGSKPEFLRELTLRKQKYVGEVPKSFSVWEKAPPVASAVSQTRAGPSATDAAADSGESKEAVGGGRWSWRG